MSILDKWRGRTKLWKVFGGQIGGEFIDGGFFRSDKVRVPYKSWTILIDQFDSPTYKRLRARFVSHDGFRFKIHRNHWPSTIGKTFGMRNIKIGEPIFDREFVLQSNDASKLAAFLANHDLRRMIQRQKAPVL